jgi:hypothetical protein
MPMRRLLVVAAAFLAGLVFVESAAACSCRIDSEKQRFDGATVAFVGTVLERTGPADDDPFSPILHTFRVDEKFKGELGATVQTRSVTACSMDAAVGDQVALYAYQDEHGLWASNCSVTTREKMAEAARPAPPTEDPGLPPPPPSQPGPPPAGPGGEQQRGRAGGVPPCMKPDATVKARTAKAKKRARAKRRARAKARRARARARARRLAARRS